jgi:acetyltransferase-like isoleucine patch superfamily enzyme
MARRDEEPLDAMRRVTIEILGRANRYARKTGRTITISKSSGGRGVDVTTLDARSAAGRERLEAFLTPVKRQYTISGLGAAEEPGAVSWRKVNLGMRRRWLLAVQLVLSMVMKGTPAKNRLLRWMGATIGRRTEIMQGAWLDHFRPELIFIGDDTVIGAFSRVSVHAYEGGGRFRWGLVEIGNGCMLGAGTQMGPIRIGDRVRTLPGTMLTPHFFRIPPDSVVGGEKPPLRRPDGGKAGRGPT